MCSDQVATNSMDLDNFDIYGKVFKQWFSKKQKFVSKMEIQLKILKKLEGEFRRFSVLFTGCFGQQNRIFGKFSGFLILPMLGND